MNFDFIFWKHDYPKFLSLEIPYVRSFGSSTYFGPKWWAFKIFCAKVFTYFFRYSVISQTIETLLNNKFKLECVQNLHSRQIEECQNELKRLRKLVHTLSNESSYK